MSSIRETARMVARSLGDRGEIVVPQGEVNRQVKTYGRFDRIQHSEIRAGFEDEWWTYSRNLYLEPVRLADRASDIATKLRGSGRLLLTHTQICDRLVPSSARRGEAGWTKGEFADIVRASFVESGWIVQDEKRGSVRRRFYALPLDELFADQHPNGRFPFSKDEVISIYNELVDDGRVGQQHGMEDRTTHSS